MIRELVHLVEVGIVSLCQIFAKLRKARSARVKPLDVET